MTHRELLSRFAGLRILVLGDAILDEYLSGECLHLSPEAPVPVVRIGGTRHVLGGAANAAANIASLGGHPQLIALVGQDAAGEELIACAARAGIDLVVIGDGRPTVRKARVIGQQQQLVRLDYEDDRPISADTERHVLQLVSERLSASDIVLLSDYAKGLLTREICQRVIQDAHRLGKEVVIDPRPEHRRFYEHGDYLTPNLREAQTLLGRPHNVQSLGHIEDTGRSLAAMLDTNVLLTLGANGMAFFSRDGREYLTMPTVAKEVFDVIGAGDTVVAAFALARAAGASNVEAMDLANQAAGVVVGKFGTATVSAAELLAEHEFSRLVSRAELAPLTARLRTAGKRITTVNGSFDLLHVGHLHILKEASRQGDVLIVGLNSDASVKGYKSPDRPILPQDQRAEMLMALRYVDYVHIFDEPVPMAFLEEVRPDVHVNGAEYGENCIEAATVKRYGGRLHLIDRIPAHSTTDLISALRATLDGGSGNPDNG